MMSLLPQVVAGAPAPGRSFEVAPPLSLRQPPHIRFGAGCAPDCVDEVRQRALKRVLVVSSPSVVRMADPIVAALRDDGIAVGAIATIPPEPGVADFDQAMRQTREFRPDGVIGLGGGSVLDVAKLLAALNGEAPASVRRLFGTDLIPGRRTALFCLPTTAGTGSEVSPNALLLDEELGRKQAAISRWLVPDAAFVDPLLTRSVPPMHTAATGVDALVHCIEAYANRFAHPLVDAYALQGIRLISHHLPRAVHHGNDLEARGAVALGSLLGGLCLGPVNTAAVHALAYPLGGEFHLGHGLSNALLLVPVLRFNLSAAAGRYADIALALGVAPSGDVTEMAERGVAEIEALCRECGLPRRLSECGIPADAIPRLAATAMGVTRLLKNNPRELSADDAARIYQSVS